MSSEAGFATDSPSVSSKADAITSGTGSESTSSTSTTSTTSSNSNFSGRNYSNLTVSTGHKQGSDSTTERVKKACGRSTNSSSRMSSACHLICDPNAPVCERLWHLLTDFSIGRNATIFCEKSECHNCALIVDLMAQNSIPIKFPDFSNFSTESQAGQSKASLSSTTSTSTALNSSNQQQQQQQMTQEPQQQQQSSTSGTNSSDISIKPVERFVHSGGERSACRSFTGRDRAACSSSNFSGKSWYT